MKNEAEEKVAKFYSEKGWEVVDGVTKDAQLYEDFRDNAIDYVIKCRKRVQQYIPESGGENMLDVGSGAVQFKEYQDYSKAFKKRWCNDLSQMGLDEAKKRIGDHGVFLHGSFFDLDLKPDFFDCTISLHCIYHMDKDKQEEAVRKMISVTKPGHRVIIVYANPRTLIFYLKVPVKILKRVVGLFKQKKAKEEVDLYYFVHSVGWWKRFRDVADVKLVPWRSFRSDDQKKLIPNSAFGKKIFDTLYNWENKYPGFFVRFFEYPLIILTKK
ncbi:MAG: class I SAM-dependent methyltransferase [Bacteroidota bacterium]